MGWKGERFEVTGAMFRTYGARQVLCGYPALRRWAKLWRAAGAAEYPT
jgi:hypothetical protein